jgi:hypothetical protein
MTEEQRCTARRLTVVDTQNIGWMVELLQIMDTVCCTTFKFDLQASLIIIGHQRSLVSHTGHSSPSFTIETTISAYTHGII